ncbi:MAG: site-specific integrase [Actinomycetota bacterium]|nr:site-specific integrase [Actinomycetota bacterium]
MSTLQPQAVLVPIPLDGAFRRAVAAHLSRYTGQTRTHTGSDLRAFLTWCTERGLDPLKAERVNVELYVRWMQEIRRYKAATISRRLSVVVGFYRTCVIDAVLTASPAEHVRRPHVPPESPTLGLSHLQFEAMLHAARTSTNINDFALVTMLGLRIFEACGADIEDLREEHGHRVLKVRGKGSKVVLTPLPPGAPGPILRNRRGVRMDRHAATRRLHHLADYAGVDLRDVQIAARHADPPPPCATTEPARTSTATPTTSSPPTWPQAPEATSGTAAGRG